MLYGEYLISTESEANPDTYRDWKREDSNFNTKDEIRWDVDPTEYWYN